MDVDNSGDYGDWRDNVVVFEFPNDTDNSYHERKMKIRNYLMNKAEVTPMLCLMTKKDRVMALFIDAADSKKCKGKIECVDDITYESVMKELHFEHWDQVLKSKWIAMTGLKENTTRQQIIDYIKKNGKIKVQEKNIYIGRVRSGNSRRGTARIECRSNSDAQKLIQTQKLSELNGSKVVMEMESPPEGESTILLLSNLDENVTEQDIADHIKEYGKIQTPPTSIKLRGKENERKSEVNFASNEDLVKTTRNLNCTQLKGKEVFMTWTFKQICNYGDWRDNVVVFKLPRGPHTSLGDRRMQVREYLMNEAKVEPMLCRFMKKGRVIAVFIDSVDSKKCKGKIRCFNDGLYREAMKKLYLEHWDLKFKSKWVCMDRLKENTTRQQIIDYIKKNGNIKVNEKDIYIGRGPNHHFYAKIECRSNSDAQKLIQTQKFSELNGSKVVIEMELPLEGKRTVLLLSNLDEDVTEQDIADHIKEHGKIQTPPTSIELWSMASNTQKRSQITFASNADLVQTVRNLNCIQLKGREVFLSWRIKEKRKSNKIQALKGRKKGKIVFKLNNQGWTKMKGQKKKRKKGGVKKSVKV